MVGNGMDPMAAIVSATSSAADPLEDVRVMEWVDFVMKGGEVVKRPAAGVQTSG